MKKIKELSGHSGCKIFLCIDEHEKYFIRKESTDIKYNIRLQEQMLKQKKYSLLNNIPFSVPYVFQTGIDENGYYFADMEFIEGSNFIDFLNTLEYDQIEKYAEKVYSIIFYFSKLKKEEHKITFKILKKLNSIFKTEISEIKIIKYFYFFLEKDYLLENIPKTECHGDLTLENVMVDKNGNLWLIDFLDSFYESYYFDITKIYQDIEFYWYQIKNKEINISKMKILCFKEKFDEYIKENLSGYLKLHNFLSGLNFLRILPYTKDKMMYKKIENIIKEIVNKGEKEL